MQLSDGKFRTCLAPTPTPINRPWQVSPRSGNSPCWHGTSSPDSLDAIAERRFVFALDAQARRVVFADGPSLKGKSFELIERLAVQFNADPAPGKDTQE